MSDAQTGPVPAPESTHAPGPVFRDRGVIIATLIARVARVEALADEWDAAVDARGGSTLAPVRFLARDLRAALAGAPAVTPTETQAEGHVGDGANAEDCPVCSLRRDDEDSR